MLFCVDFCIVLSFLLRLFCGEFLIVHQFPRRVWGAVMVHFSVFSFKCYCFVVSFGDFTFCFPSALWLLFEIHYSLLYFPLLI